ncbi:GNAT family N-acetyltransferase [Streptomyces tsukubensis]|uniref:GNAT family N-acetyltransferase n=1 Tax=Streptomyces tsukubensis TaxID=83656 RepID=A0A1V4AF59_9ACTN|nr:GNAT family N-acetyltransferase [Streptomyces tsukubensis]
MPGDGLSVHHTSVDDPLVRPMLDELAREYRGRYGSDHDLHRYPAAEFAPPEGEFLLLLENGEAVAGGAYRRHSPLTAELKRIWTHSEHRRRGLARRVLLALEQSAVAAGYQRLYLTTGPRQPEAKGLYLASGYRPLFDLSVDPETIGPLPFEKDLPPAPDGPNDGPPVPPGTPRHDLETRTS